jgi:plasmid stability protein
MATLTIRNLDERTKAQLRVQAARHGRSMEEEARTILRSAIESTQAEVQVERLGSRIHAHFAALGGMELDLPERSSAPAAAEFEPR